MKRIFNTVLMAMFFCLMTTSCLRSGLEELTNSPNKELTAVNYTYRFQYNDTIKKGTPNEEIQKGRVCEVMFNKNSVQVKDGEVVKGYKTTITYDLNSILKSGPTGSVTKQMLFDKFEALIQAEGLTKLWVYVTISDAASVMPLDGAPKLGSPGDFSKPRSYRVKAADGSTADYMLETTKGF